MRVAVSGSHSTGKSTLIASFLAECPEYGEEPEAYEILADDLAFDPSEGPDVATLETLLDYTLEALAGHRPGACVVFERSPIDYLAYALANPSIVESESAELLRSHRSVVRESLGSLDLIVLVPVSEHVGARPGEDEDLRNRVDDALRRALIDDDHDLLDDPGAPRVVELSESPERQLVELVAFTRSGRARETVSPKVDLVEEGGR